MHDRQPCDAKDARKRCYEARNICFLVVPIVRVDEQLEEISRLDSPCRQQDEDGQASTIPQGIEGGVAIVSRLRPSQGLENQGSSRRGGDHANGAGLKSAKKKLSELGGGATIAEGFARGVHDSWRVGKKGCDNGFVLVASREDRSFAISVVRIPTVLGFQKDLGRIIHKHK